MEEEKLVNKLKMIDPFTLTLVSLMILICGSQLLALTQVNAFAIIMPVIIFSIFISNVIIKGTNKLYDDYKNDKTLDKEDKNKLLFQSLILVTISSLLIFALNKLLFNSYVNMFNISKETLLSIKTMEKDLFLICSLIPFSLYMTMLTRINRTRSLKFIALFMILFFILVFDNALRYLYSEGITSSLLAVIALEMLLKLVSLRRKNNEAYLVRNISFKKNTLKIIFKEGLKNSYDSLLEFIFKVMIFFFASYAFGEEMLLISFIMVVVLDFGKLITFAYSNGFFELGKNSDIKRVHMILGIKLLCILVFMILLAKPLTLFILKNEYILYKDTLIYSVILITLALITKVCMNIFLKSLSDKGREKEVIILNILNKAVLPCLILYFGLVSYTSNLIIAISLLVNEIAGLIIAIIAQKIVKNK